MNIVVTNIVPHSLRFQFKGIAVLCFFPMTNGMSFPVPISNYTIRSYIIVTFSFKVITKYLLGFFYQDIDSLEENRFYTSHSLQSHI